MKKLLVILLMFVYTLPAISMNVSMHYCGGKLASISFFGDNSNGCACPVKKMKKSCCQTKNLSFTFKDSHQKADVATISTLSQIEVHALSDFSAFSFELFEFVAPCDLHNYSDPPNSNKVPLYLLNRVFRI